MLVSFIHSKRTFLSRGINIEIDDERMRNLRIDLDYRHGIASIQPIFDQCDGGDEDVTSDSDRILAEILGMPAVRRELMARIGRPLLLAVLDATNEYIQNRRTDISLIPLISSAERHENLFGTPTGGGAKVLTLTIR